MEEVVGEEEEAREEGTLKERIKTEGENREIKRDEDKEGERQK